MALYGILSGTDNSGKDNEILTAFSTPLVVYSNQPVFRSTTLSLKIRTSSQGVQRWEIEANLVPTVGDAGLLLHMLKYNKSGIFKIRMPQVYKLRDDNDSTSKPLVGEFFNYNNHPKVYICTGYTSDVPPKPIPFPNLPTTYANATNTVQGASVTMLAYYEDSVQLGIRYVDGVLSDPGSVRFVEAL